MSIKTNDSQLDSTTQKNVNLWLNGNYDENTKTTIRELIKKDPKAVINSFYTSLSFGTGGLRGVMGVGTNRINAYTIQFATQGFANYINKNTTDTTGTTNATPSVFIGFDSRHQSQFFAQETAKVLAGNGIQVFLCETLRPTPLVSFGCRLKKCAGAIMITASHNPPEYNGYKVYWNDGAQVLPPHDQGIIDEVKKITDVNLVKFSELNDPLIHIVKEEVDSVYYDTVEKLQLFPKTNKEKGNRLKVIYSNLHGTGITLIPKTLERWGFTSLTLVEKQNAPDGSFPTVKSPNPEEQKALALGIEEMQKTNGDILIATDPDADRMGVVVMHNNSPILLNGNQIACICLQHVCQTLTTQKNMPKNAAFVKTIVTSELFKTITTAYNSSCFDVLTGFKYIAEKIRSWEENNSYQFIFGGEESYGYLLGTHSRDKDAIISSALICEVALQAKEKGLTLIDFLHEIYKQHGVYRESLISVLYPETKEGKDQMKTAIDNIRKNPPKKLNNTPIVSIEDYSTSTKMCLKTGKSSLLPFPESNVLLFWLEDKSKIVVRPSGTEPKIKLYGGVVEKTTNTSAGEGDDSITASIDSCDQKVANYLEALKNILL